MQKISQYGRSTSDAGTSSLDNKGTIWGETNLIQLRSEGAKPGPDQYTSFIHGAGGVVTRSQPEFRIAMDQSCLYASYFLPRWTWTSIPAVSCLSSLRVRLCLSNSQAIQSRRATLKTYPQGMVHTGKVLMHSWTQLNGKILVFKSKSEAIIEYDFYCCWDVREI